jgi:hypothetical protein
VTAALYAFVAFGGATVGASVAWWVRDRLDDRRRAHQDGLERRIDAWRHADARTDLDQVGPIRPTPVDPTPPAWVNDRGLS